MSRSSFSAAIATLGIDLGKNSFHLVGQDQRGAIVLRIKLSRPQLTQRLANIPPCLIGMEACAGHTTSATQGRMTMLQDTTGHRVLLVEDEAMIAMLVEDMLEDLGRDLAAVATRLEEALALSRSEAFDLAILDLNLGGVLTYPVADALRDRGVPFIFATGYGSSGLKDTYTDLPTLQKTYTQEALGHAITAAFNSKP